MAKEKKTEKEKLEQRRKEVLSRGRKFKYPLQYAKHHLVLIAIIVAVVAVIGLTAAGWAMLYKAQDTGDVAYRLTKILPLPVANIEGEDVRYSDYLMIYRSSITPVERQGSAGSLADFEGMRDYYKRAALTEAENFTYIMKLAKEQGITVSDEEINKAFDEHRTAGGTERSKESFLKVLSDNFGMSEKEYRRMLYFSLLKMKVAEKIDKNAANLVREVSRILAENENSFDKVFSELGDKLVFEETGGMVSNLNVDGGRAEVAMNLEKGVVSESFMSNNGDGYYFVKLVDKNDSEVNYQSIKVPFTTLNEKLDEIRRSGEIKEYIEIPEVEEAEAK